MGLSTSLLQSELARLRLDIGKLRDENKSLKQQLEVAAPVPNLDSKLHSIETNLQTSIAQEAEMREALLAAQK